MDLNQKVFYALNSLAGQSPVLDSVIVFAARALPWILIAIVVVYFVFLHRHLVRLAMVAFTTLFSILASDLLKNAIFRHPRPFAALPDVIQLIQISPYDSFPSGHATAFAALATGMFIYDKRLGSFFILGALVVGAARVAAGIHYPIDILTGYLIGFAITFFSYKLWRRLEQGIRNYIS